MKVVLDASLVIGLVSNKDPLHERAEQVMEQIIDFDLVIPALTRAEVLIGYVSVGDEARGEKRLAALGARTIPALINNEFSSPEEQSNAWTALVARTRVTSGLKLADAVVLATAIQTGGYVATLDEKLHKAAQAAGCAFDYGQTLY